MLSHQQMIKIQLILSSLCTRKDGRRSARVTFVVRDIHLAPIVQQQLDAIRIALQRRLVYGCHARMRNLMSNTQSRIGVRRQPLENIIITVC